MIDEIVILPMIVLYFRYHKAKTKFLCNPEKGILELEQKLPFSWHAFNETPKYEVIMSMHAYYKFLFSEI